MAEREEITRGGSGESSESAVSAFFRRLGEYPRRFRQFLHETRVELKHVSWPTKDDVKSTTVVVVITIFVFGAFLFGVDKLVSEIVKWVLGSFK
jgi:preprotein translocase subunit SecE